MICNTRISYHADNKHTTASMHPDVEYEFRSRFHSIVMSDIRLGLFGTRRHAMNTCNITYRVDIDPAVLSRVGCGSQDGARPPSLYEVLDCTTIWIEYDDGKAKPKPEEEVVVEDINTIIPIPVTLPVTAEIVETAVQAQNVFEQSAHHISPTSPESTIVAADSEPPSPTSSETSATTVVDKVLFDFVWFDRENAVPRTAPTASPGGTPFPPPSYDSLVLKPEAGQLGTVLKESSLAKRLLTKMSSKKSTATPGKAKRMNWARRFIASSVHLI